ncbi:MAG: glycosyltransferase family 2 protein [Leptolyngbyaceae cyanobacterium bins.59]|nr:glycosyltransferase family 2 protein [Leptolyngbyaceae cyanobacterium bins.59]
MIKNLSQPTISIIIPALNEEANVQKTVMEVLDVLPDYFSDYELLLINDGSTDQTGAVMEHLAKDYGHIRVFHSAKNLGLGASYKRGVAEARFEYIMIVFSDGGLPPANLVTMFEQIGKADIVVGYVPNLKQIKSLTRYLISRSYTVMLNFLFGLNIKYYNGSAIYRREAFADIDITSERFGFQGEILVKLLKLGYSYVQAPVPGAVGKTDAVRVKNFVNVGKTLLGLLLQVYQLKLMVNDSSSKQEIRKRNNTLSSTYLK